MGDAVAEQPHAASVCIHPQFVKFVRRLQQEQPDRYPHTLKVCTVVHSATGTQNNEKVLEDTRQAVLDGADEIDLVINYKLLKENEQSGREAAESLVKLVRSACPTDKILLKVVLDSGELARNVLITAACEAAIEGGCDFLKVSMGN